MESYLETLIKKQIHTCIIIILVENFFLLNYYSYDFLIQVKVTCRYHNYRFLQQNDILFFKNPARIALTDFISGYGPRCKAYYEVKTFIDQNVKINNFGDRGGIVED